VIPSLVPQLRRFDVDLACVSALTEIMTPWWLKHQGAEQGSARQADRERSRSALICR
jgi:hypothetical protein